MKHPALQEDQISGYFRANVGIVIINHKGQVLAAERRERKGAWQLPQGGIDQGEDEEQAALREMREEVGFSKEDIEQFIRPLGTHAGWFAYQLPKDLWSNKRGRGQAQKFFAYRYVGSDERLNDVFKESEEFSTWKWTSLTDLLDETWEVRQPVYEAVCRAFGDYLT
jgi:putative (di)nucleoside polyphosphate hydrolase